MSSQEKRRPLYLPAVGQWELLVLITHRAVKEESFKRSLNHRTDSVCVVVCHTRLTAELACVQFINLL